MNQNWQFEFDDTPSFGSSSRVVSNRTMSNANSLKGFPSSMGGIRLPYYTIFMIPIPRNLSSNDLRDFLEKFASILSVYIPPDQCYAFVKVRTIFQVCFYGILF
jgi:RNA recognition motif-containing protein